MVFSYYMYAETRKSLVYTNDLVRKKTCKTLCQSDMSQKSQIFIITKKKIGLILLNINESKPSKHPSTNHKIDQ